MSLKPETTPPPESAGNSVLPILPTQQPATLRRRRIWMILFAIFAFEIGMFLVAFPWMDAWTLNHLPAFFPKHEIQLQDVWDDPYFRSALSGLGLLNLYIALRQALQLILRRT